jgi:hypothetical protein
LKENVKREKSCSQRATAFIHRNLIVPCRWQTAYVIKFSDIYGI